MNEPAVGSYPRAKYLAFEPGPDKPKTKTWRVVSDTFVGIIAWRGPWRQYSFFPEPGSVFEKTCLRDIANFCEYQSSVHRAALKLRSEK